jgi:hypothetical protein
MVDRSAFTHISARLPDEDGGGAVFDQPYGLMRLMR